MRELIEALELLAKYGEPAYPFHCEHDVLVICGIDPADVSAEDKCRLEAYGFFESEEYEGHFASFKYGSA